MQRKSGRGASSAFSFIHQNLQDIVIQLQALKYSVICSALDKKAGGFLDQLPVIGVRTEELLILVEGRQVFEVNLPNQHI